MAGDRREPILMRAEPCEDVPSSGTLGLLVISRMTQGHIMGLFSSVSPTSRPQAGGREVCLAWWCLDLISISNPYSAGWQKLDQRQFSIFQHYTEQDEIAAVWSFLNNKKMATLYDRKDNSVPLFPVLASQFQGIMWWWSRQGRNQEGPTWFHSFMPKMSSGSPSLSMMISSLSSSHLQGFLEATPSQWVPHPSWVLGSICGRN